MVMADLLCPPCRRGEHEDCWGVEPPRGVPRLGCPCQTCARVTFEDVRAAETSPVPLWQLCEKLQRQATEIIDGRASFERFIGRPSAKPLRKIELDPRDVLRLVAAAGRHGGEEERT